VSPHAHRRIASAVRGRLAWQTRPAPPVLAIRTPPGAIRTTANDHPRRSLLFFAVILKAWRSVRR